MPTSRRSSRRLNRSPETPDGMLSKQGDCDQDIFWKITIPYSERRRALAQLELMNVNAFSLFDTDDALMEILYNRCVLQKSL